VEGEGGMGRARVRDWAVGGCFRLPSLWGLLALGAGSLGCDAAWSYLRCCEGLYF
jgi:hypothetical protein